MRVVIQRVSEANVKINSKLICSIREGLLVLLGIEKEDSVSDVNWLTNKISNLRIFSDNDGKMNSSIKEIDGEIIVEDFSKLFDLSCKDPQALNYKTILLFSYLNSDIKVKSFLRNHKFYLHLDY